MPSVQLICETCGLKAKRKLLEVPGCRGIHETPSEPASCPSGHGEMVRVDGVKQLCDLDGGSLPVDLFRSKR